MKNSITILFMLLVMGQQAFAITNVSGTLTGVTTFTKANGPYVVNAHLLLNEGATLIIEPGTEIRVDSAVNFFVEGSLYAIGTVADPIIFKSNSAGPTRTSWQGIHIRFMGVVDSIVFDHCQFTSSAEALKVSSAKLSVTNCMFTECEKAMSIYNNINTNFAVANNTIKHGGEGITAYAPGLISSNEFAHLNSIAIGTYQDIDVIGNYVHDGAVGIVIDGTYDNVMGEVTGNKVVNVANIAYMVADGTTPGGSIHHNISAYNGIGYTISSLSQSPVRYNTSIHDSLGVLMYDILLPGVFKNNCIDSCKNYYVKVVGWYDVDISGNYWGTADTNVVKTRMFDYYDDFVSPKGQILPVLSQPDSGCQSYTGPVVTSVAPVNAKPIAITVSPNPFAGSFTIDLQGRATQLEVFNMAGQRVYNTGVSGRNKLEVDMSAYPVGVYYYRVTLDDHTTATGKLVKQ